MAVLTPMKMVTSLFFTASALEFLDSEQGRLETVDRDLNPGQEHKWGCVVYKAGVWAGGFLFVWQGRRLRRMDSVR